MPKETKVKEPKVFGICDKEGKLVRLVEAHTLKEVKDYLLRDTIIGVASALTVSRSNLKTEKAAG